MCGIFGVYGEGMEAARLVHTGLWALQHRGQESSGIASSEGGVIRVFKNEGLVAHVYDEEHLSLLSGYAAIGHNRYSTSGGGGILHAQPVHQAGDDFAFVHNGNLPDSSKIKKFLKSKSIEYKNLNDSEMMYEVIKYYYSQNNDISESIVKSYKFFTGVFCFLVLTSDSLIAVRDKKGIRPLVLGKLNGGYIFSSETCALDTIGASLIREVLPGEMLTIHKHKVTSKKIVKGEERLDIFEFIYFSRPDSLLLGKKVNEVRKQLGRNLANEAVVDAEVVIPVPDSAIPAALGYSEATKIPFDHGLIKNRYIHRTFISPAQKLREKNVDIKLNPLPESIKGKKVAIVDDSIVRGTTAKKLVQRIRDVGAKEIHLLISSPPVRYPDFYGIDTPNQDDLIASKMSIPQMEKFLGVDSLHFLSYEGMISATGLPESTLSTSCFSGIYPVSIGKRKLKIKREPHKKQYFYTRSISSVG